MEGRGHRVIFRSGVFLPVPKKLFSLRVFALFLILSLTSRFHVLNKSSRGKYQLYQGSLTEQNGLKGLKAPWLAASYKLHTVIIPSFLNYLKIRPIRLIRRSSSVG
jgi:hypothetical protein